MRVEVFVRYRQVIEVDARSVGDALLFAPQEMRMKIPGRAFDVQIEALHCPPVSTRCRPKVGRIRERYA